MATEFCVKISYQGFELDIPWAVQKTAAGYKPVYESDHGHVVQINPSDKTMICDLKKALSTHYVRYLTKGQIALPVAVKQEPALFSIPPEGLLLLRQLKDELPEDENKSETASSSAT